MLKTPIQINKAVSAERKRIMEGSNNGGLDHWAFIHDDETTRVNYAAACYYNTRYKPEGEDKKAIRFLSWHTKKHQGEELAMVLRYLNYLFKTSPFSSYYIGKDPKKALEQPFCVRTDIHPSLMISASIAVRYRHEYIERVKIWDKLKDHMHHDVAFLLAQLFKVGGADYYIHSPTMGHNVFDMNWSKPMVRAFLTHQPIAYPDNQKVVNGYYEYYPLNRVWGDNKQGGALAVPPPEKVVKKKSQWLGDDDGDYNKGHYMFANASDNARAFLNANNCGDLYDEKWKRKKI